MLVLSDVHALGHHGIEDELEVRRLPSKQDLLNHMVAVDVLSQLPHVALQIVHKQINVLLMLHNLNHLLDAASPMGVSTKADGVLANSMNDLLKLLKASILSYFLSQVVAKGIVHQFPEVFNGVLEDQFIYFSFLLIDLLLQKPAAALVFGHNVAVLNQMLELVLL